MLVSVIMPAYNAEKTICAAIESVIKQTYENWELIIVNDCSVDRTPEIATDYSSGDSRIRTFSNEKNLGASRTRHRAIEEASGEWIAFLDSDDVWKADKLEKQIELQKAKNAGIVFTASAFIDNDGNKFEWVLHVPEELRYRKLLKQNIMSNSSVLIDKSLYLEFEIVGENMHEDFACWLNLLRSGAAAYGIDEPLLEYRLSTNSKSGNKLKSAKMNWNTYRRMGLDIFSSAYYMAWYTMNGLRKYKHFIKVNRNRE